MGKAKKKKQQRKEKAENQIESGTVATNRKASHDYLLSDTYMAGIQLTGTEVKSVRCGTVDMRGSFVKIVKGEAFLYACKISEYKFGNIHNHDPFRIRKLLLNKREIEKLEVLTTQKNKALVPTKIFFKKNRVKVNIRLGEGKQKHDKRDTLKAKAQKRDIDRALKNFK